MILKKTMMQMVDGAIMTERVRLDAECICSRVYMCSICLK